MQTCPICYDEITKARKMECCKNSFCDGCLDEWLKVKNCCPICNKQMEGEVFNNIINKEQEFDNGALQLEKELQEIQLRMKYIHSVIQNKRNQAKSVRNTSAQTNSNFLQQQYDYMLDDYEIAANACDVEDRITAVKYLQLITQRIYLAESVISGETFLQEDYSQYQSQYNNEEYQLLYIKPIKNKKKKLKT